jgi:hypothetical protein
VGKIALSFVRMEGLGARFCPPYVQITVDRRTGEAWRSEVLRGGDDLAPPEFGLACPVNEV